MPRPDVWRGSGSVIGFFDKVGCIGWGVIGCKARCCGGGVGLLVGLVAWIIHVHSSQILCQCPMSHKRCPIWGHLGFHRERTPGCFSSTCNIRKDGISGKRRSSHEQCDTVGHTSCFLAQRLFISKVSTYKYDTGTAVTSGGSSRLRLSEFFTCLFMIPTRLFDARMGTLQHQKDNSLPKRIQKEMAFNQQKVLD